MDSIKTAKSTTKRLRHFSKKTGGLCRNGLHVIVYEIKALRGGGGGDTELQGKEVGTDK